MNDPVLHAGPKRYAALDGMRGLCAVMVALRHFDFVLGTGVLAKHGWLSVDLFFVLSGFVIALKYEDRLRAGNGFWTFLRARAARLLPVQALGTVAVTLSLLTLYLAGRLPGVNPISLGTAFFFGLVLVPISLSPAAVVSFPWAGPFPVNPPLWSLQGEWIANIFYARFLSSVRTRFFVLLWTILASYLVIHVFRGQRLWDLTRPPELIPCLVRAAIGFLAGVAVHRANRRGFLAGLPAISPRIVFGVWLLICLVPDASPMPVFESLVALIGAPLSVALLVRGERPLPSLYAGLGRLSYPLYASHFAIVNLAMIWVAPKADHNLLFLIPMLLAALFLAWGIERLTAMLQTRKRDAVSDRASQDQSLSVELL